MVAPRSDNHHDGEWSDEEWEGNVLHFIQSMETQFPEWFKDRDKPGDRFAWKKGDLVPTGAAHASVESADVESTA